MDPKYARMMSEGMQKQAMEKEAELIYKEAYAVIGALACNGADPVAVVQELQKEAANERALGLLASLPPDRLEALIQQLKPSMYGNVLSEGLAAAGQNSGYTVPEVLQATGELRGKRNAAASGKPGWMRNFLNNESLVTPSDANPTAQHSVAHLQRKGVDPTVFESALGKAARIARKVKV